MARLYEYQGKELLREEGITVPRGVVANTPDEAMAAAGDLGGEVVVKAQVWATSRRAGGGIVFAGSPEEARDAAERIIGTGMGNFRVERVLVEEKLDISEEYFASVIIDDTARRPLVIFSSTGGSGVEEVASRHPERVASTHVDIVRGLRDFEARDLAARAGIGGKRILGVASALVKLYGVARKYEARSAEINPLVVTADGKIAALDCRVTVDDNAVFRHPELGIEIAREFHRPATELDRIAYRVEAGDFRGTFYFVQMAEGFGPEGHFVGFHGAGGGGSMMSMDALMSKGFRVANFCDTSGNPPASKVYRAARIILSQPGIVGYFASGSGVASQEQFHSARGLLKAFRDVWLRVPAVIRLGGNREEKAIEILESHTRDLPAPVECYGKDDSAEFCARRMRELVDGFRPRDREPPPPRGPAKEPYSFETLTGNLEIDHARCRDCGEKPCVEACIVDILKFEDGLPVLAISREDAARGKCVECLWCEQECRYGGGNGAIEIALPIEGLEEHLDRPGETHR